MKTLKYLFMALLLAATAAGFTSCSDDDDDNGGGGNNNAREIVGTWERETGNYTEKNVILTRRRILMYNDQQ